MSRPASGEPSPEGAAWLPSRVTFSWLFPLLRKGKKSPLQMEDLWALDPTFDSRKLAEDFLQHWRQAMLDAEGAADKKKVHLTTVLFKAYGRKFLPLGLIKLGGDVANCLAPILLQNLIKFVASAHSNPKPLWSGILLAIGLFLLNMYATVSISYFFQRVTTFGMGVRTALTGAIYRKALNLSGGARQEFGSAKITNMVSTDLPRMELFIVFFHLMWTFNVQILFIISLLIANLGVSALAGVGLLIALIPLQAVMIGRLVSLRRANAVNTDMRIKLTSEMLSGIRVLKFFAWEDSFMSRIAAIRSTELKAVISANLMRSFNTAMGFAVPVLAAAISFIVYYLLNTDNFDPTVIFTALAWFNQLRNPVMWMPQGFSAYADAKIAILRMESLLKAEEVEFMPEVSPGCSDAVVVEHGNFTWDTVPFNDSKVDVISKKDESPKKDGNAKDEAPADASGIRTELTDAVASTRASSDSSNGLAMPIVNSSAAILNLSRKSVEGTSLGGKKHIHDVGLSDSPSHKEALLRFERPTLEEIVFAIPKGSLVAITGAVGSGKSSLLSALIGGLKPVRSSDSSSPRVVFSGSVGYVPQQAWILNSTLKENILFGLELDQERYDRAIDVCSLRHDLQVLSGGDEAEIGEKGINLSGGQKQRVSLARVVYQNCDIVLLDDCLSAVDAQVGREIFENCITGALHGKTRLLVTHQLHFVPACDFVLTMKNGRVEEMGSYADLMSKEDGVFAGLMQSYGGVQKGTEKIEVESTIPTIKEKLDQPMNDHKGERTGLIKEEERQVGTLQNSLILTFSIAMGGPIFLGLLIFILIMTQVTRIINDLWLVYWTSNSFSSLSGLSYLYVYLGLGISQALSLFIYSAMVAVGGVRAAKNLQFDALKRIVHAPIQFFDSNPLGRILNRFSRDQDIIDNILPDAVRLFSVTLATCLATFGLVLYSTSGWFTLGLVPMGVVYFFTQDIYRRSARELKRLESVSRSPLYAHITESMQGIPTIRAYKREMQFEEKTDSLLNSNNRPYYFQVTSQRWLGMRLESIGNVLVLVTTIIFVINRNNLSPALTGLAFSYVLQVTQLLSLCIRQFTECEVQLVSVERLNNYAKEVAIEAPPIIEACRPPEGWPSQGKLDVSSLSMRYQEELPLVIDDISLSTRPREKIGIVGRTGSGKSTLLLALFRMVEPLPGSRIDIDGVNILTLGLHDLRSNLAIVTQDPILFSGSVRSNLDPFQKFSDCDLWEALEKSGLKTAVSEMELGLDAKVDAGGDNLSVGQRQLLCLARALLSRAVLILLDEATASIDLDTDFMIQKTIRENLKDCATITIAHRLNTIIDSDRVLVLENGRVAEFDTPQNLLERTPASLFSKMIDETGKANAATLKAIIRSQR